MLSLFNNVDKQWRQRIMYKWRAVGIAFLLFILFTGLKSEKFYRMLRVRSYAISENHSKKIRFPSLQNHTNTSEPKLVVTSQLFMHYLTDYEKIPGYVRTDAFYALWVIIQFQYKYLHITDGAIGEIGVHRGKFTSYLYLLRHRNRNQKLFAVDVFSKKHLNIDKSGDGDRNEFLNNVISYANVFNDEVNIYEGSSLDLNPSFSKNTTAQRRWREILGDRGCQIVSIDGGHTTLLTFSDLCLISKCLVDGGIVMVDDIDHPGWLGVRDGAIQFLGETSLMFNTNDDPEVAGILSKNVVSPSFDMSCRFIDRTTKVTGSALGCARLVPVLHYNGKLYLTTPNYYPLYIQYLSKLNDKGLNYVVYDALRSTLGNVPIWSGAQVKQHDIFERLVRPAWLEEITEATR